MSKKKKAAKKKSGDSKQALLDAIEACESGSALKKLFDSPKCEELSYGEAELYPEGAKMLADKARSWTKASDVAQAITWLVRLSGFHPICIVRPDKDASLAWELKKKVATIVDGERDFYRERIRDKSAALRVAAGHALARCRNVNKEDHKVLLELVASERDEGALATFVLALGVVSYRLEQSPVEARSKDRLVRCASVAAEALSNPQLSDDALRILAEHLEKPVALPSGWGWFYGSGACDSRDLAFQLCHWILHRDPQRLVDALTRAEKGGAKFTPSASVAGVLARLAFGGQLPASGVALEDLDDKQRATVKAMAKGDNFKTLRRLGFWSRDDIDDFFKAKAPAWRPLPIDSAHWHFHKIWYARAHGEIDEDAAAKAILSGLKADELLPAMLSRLYRGVLSENDPGPEGRQREQALALRIFRELDKDLLAMLDKTTSKLDRFESDLAALAVLDHCKKKPIPERWHPVIAKAMTTAKTVEPLKSYLKDLDAPLRERLLLDTLTGLRPNWEWPALRFADIQLSKPVLEAIVDKVTHVPDQRDEAAAIVRKDERTKKLLASLRFDDKAQKRTADALLNDL